MATNATVGSGTRPAHSIRGSNAQVAVAAAAGLIVGAAGAANALDSGFLTAGPFTTFESGVGAYSQPQSQLDAEQLKQFLDGKAKFAQPWGVAPKSTVVWGLGPLFNEDRCSECHKFNGRARAPADGEEVAHGMVIRLSVPGRNGEGGPNPHPAYGDQLNNRSIPGVPPEGQAIVTYEPREMTLADGEIVQLRSPRVRFSQLQLGELGPQTMSSLRIAPSLIGLGLLEAVPEEVILEVARAQTLSGVKGRPNYVWDFEVGRRALGRFGWKASQPSLRQRLPQHCMTISARPAPSFQTRTARRYNRRVATRPRLADAYAQAAAARRTARKHCRVDSLISPSISRRWRCLRGATSWTKKCDAARSCSDRQGVARVIYPT